MRASIQKQVIGWILLFFLLAGLQVNAAQEIILNSNGHNNLRIIENTTSRLRVINTICSFNTLMLNTGKGEFVELLMNSYSKTNTIGAPQLPVLSRLIEIPEGSNPEVKVISYELKEFKLADFGITQKIFPAQAPLSKSNTRDNPIAFNKQIYESNSFYSEAIARVEVAGNLRGVQLANLILSPFEYNPVTNTIRVYDNLVVEINFLEAHKLKTVENRAKTESTYYNGVYSNVLNYKKSEINAESITGIPVKYVIVSDPMFREVLQPFVTWKTKRGFKVIEAYTTDPAVGMSLTSIKAYLKNLYASATSTDPAPTFVLFVGDVAQIPAFNCGTYVSDLYYCEYTGDYLPEVFYGRFSANNVGELLPQINKTLQYEQYLMPDPSFLNEVVMAAGADASHQMRWGNGQVNYVNSYYFNEAHNLVPHTFLQPEPAGSNYSRGIQSTISNGVSYANYSAHGSPEGWADPLFSISDIANLTNNGKYCLMVGNSCQTNAYDQNSFGEALLRAENKGALGYIGASGLSYWDEDFWWSVGNGSIVSNPTYETTGLGAYDRIFHDHGEPRSEWYSTMGQMVFAGNLAVQESNSEMKKQYWETYCLMGDPSTMIYFGIPPALSVDYMPLLPLGTSTFKIRTQPFASVAISKKNYLHGVAEADENGLAVVSLQPFTEPGYADIVVTMQNRQPYIDSVRVETPGGPYLALKNVLIKDQDGNNNNLPESGELLSVSISLDNLGKSDAGKVYSTLSSNNNNYFSIRDDTYYWPVISGNGSASAENAFTLQVSDDVPDMHNATLTVTTQTDSGTFMSDFNFLVFAPKLVNGTNIFDDTKTGNGNGQIDRGETIVITMPVTNTGHSTSEEVTTQLFVFGDFVNTISPPFNLGKLAPGDTGISTFSFTVNPDAKPGSQFSIYLTATAGSYNSVSGLRPVIGTQVEDFESYTFQGYSMQFKGNKPWEVNSAIRSEGLFGAKSGAISNSERSEMFIDGKFLFNDTISFYRKVASENGYDFLKFYIDGIELGDWSGNKDWEKMKYPVSAGSHRFSWVYEKDEATSAGMDAAWIDYIQFPAFSQESLGKLTVNTLAVPDTICAGEQAQLYVFAAGEEGNYSYSWKPADKFKNTGIYNQAASPNETTTYSVLLNSNSGVETGTITVNVQQPPATPVITVSDVQFVSSAISGNQWFNSQGLIPGANAQEYFPLTIETYYVIACSNGCKSDASNEVRYGFTGINTSDEKGVSVYPNPFNGKLFINFTTKFAGRVKIVIYNSSGSEVTLIEEEKAAGKHKVTVDGSHLASGIYTCMIFSGNDVQLAKVIKN